MDFAHRPVLLDACIQGLCIKPDGVYIDGTVGGAGHAREIAKRLTTGRLLALDRDPDAVATARERLQPYPCATVVQANFSELDAVLSEQGLSRVDGILLDLGVSSFQLDNASRGFSYRVDAPLDMRMSKTGVSARDVVNGYDFESLCRVLRVYGEERFAASIAKRIIQERATAPIETTGQLEALVKAAMPAAERRKKHPCKRTFQALRIEVNGELSHLERGLARAFAALSIGGRLAVITFHSLEDRLVKHAYRDWCAGCTCPPDFPVCVCGKTPRAHLVNRKPILPSDAEQDENPRSRSAKLRILEKNQDE